AERQHSLASHGGEIFVWGPTGIGLSFTDDPTLVNALLPTFPADAVASTRLSLLHVACTARIACKWVRESRLCSQNTTLPPYARRVCKPSPLIVRQGSRRLASRNVSRRPSEVEPSPERVRWPGRSRLRQISTAAGALGSL